MFAYTAKTRLKHTLFLKLPSQSYNSCFQQLQFLEWPLSEIFESLLKAAKNIQYDQTWWTGSISNRDRENIKEYRINLNETVNLDKSWLKTNNCMKFCACMSMDMHADTSINAKDICCHMTLHWQVEVEAYLGYFVWLRQNVILRIFIFTHLHGIQS